MVGVMVLDQMVFGLMQLVLGTKQFTMALSLSHMSSIGGMVKGTMRKVIGCRLEPHHRAHAHLRTDSGYSIFFLGAYHVNWTNAPFLLVGVYVNYLTLFQVKYVTHLCLMSYLCRPAIHL